MVKTINLLVAPGYIGGKNMATVDWNDQQTFCVVSLDRVKDYLDLFDPDTHFDKNKGNGCTMEESVHLTRGLVLGFTTESSFCEFDTGYNEYWHDYKAEDGGKAHAVKTDQMDTWFSRPDEIAHVTKRAHYDKTPYAERYQRHNKQIVKELEYLHIPNARYIEHLQHYLQTFVLDRDDVSLNMSIDLRTRLDGRSGSTIKFELEIKLSNRWEDLVIWLTMPHKNDDGTTEWKISSTSYPRIQGDKAFYGNYTHFNREVKKYIHEIPRIGRFLNLCVPTSASPLTWHIREEEYKDLIAPEYLFFDEDAKTVTKS